MQLYAVNFIPLLSSLYMFRAQHTPIIRGTMFNLSTATGTNHSIGTDLHSYFLPVWPGTASPILWFVPVAVDTVEHCTPYDGRVWRPKHVE